MFQLTKITLTLCHLICTRSGIDESTSNMILKTMLDKPGIGTSCMSDLQDISDYVYCTESQENNFTLQYNVSFLFVL